MRGIRGLREEYEWACCRTAVGRILTKRAKSVPERRVIPGKVNQATAVEKISVQDEIACRSRNGAVVPGWQFFVEFKRHRGSKFR